MWYWCQRHLFSCISHFSWSKLHQKYVMSILIVSRIEFHFKRIPSLKIWVKAHGDKFKNDLRNFFFHLLPFRGFTQKMVTHTIWLTSSPWILLVVIKLIFVVHSFSRPFFYFKISLMLCPFLKWKKGIKS